MTGLAATARQRSSRLVKLHPQRFDLRTPQPKKKGRPKFERPKSREETPKEGYDRRANSSMSQCNN